MIPFRNPRQGKSFPTYKREIIVLLNHLHVGTNSI